MQGRAASEVAARREREELVGTGRPGKDWHGIAAEMMDDEVAASIEGLLVVA